MQGPLPIAPGRESLRLADRESNLRVAEGRDSGRFFSHHKPAAVDRITFEDQRRGVEQATRRMFADEAGRSVRADAAATPQAPANRADRTGRSGSETIRSFDTPARSERAVQGEDRANENGSRQFGSPGSTRPSSFDHRGDRTASQFGQPSAAPNRPERAADTESRGWRRVGEGDTHTPVRAERSSERNSGDSADWRRFGSRNESSNIAPGVNPNRAERSFDEGSARSGQPIA